MTNNNNNEQHITDAELEQREKKQGWTEKTCRFAIGGFNKAVGAFGLKGIDIDGVIEGIKAGTITPNETLGWAEEAMKILSKWDKGFKVAKKVVSKVPILGKWLSGAVSLLKGAVSISHHVMDRMKDACIDLSISSLSLKVGKAQKGITDTNKKLDQQGKDMRDGFDKAGKALQQAKGELEGKMAGMSSQIEGLEEGLGSVQQGLHEVRHDIEGLKSDLETQGHELKQAMGEMKSELQDQIHQQAELFDSKLQAQDAKFTQEVSRLDSEIASLTGEMRQQKIELKAEIQQKNEETKQQLRSEMEQQKQALEKQIQNLTQAQNRINEEIQEHIQEIDERLDLVEKRTLANARKIFEEKLERERKDQELTEAIKTTNLKLENLNQEKLDLANDFSKYQGQINQQTAQTQQDLESLETEYTKQTESLNIKIADNQDRLDDYEEELANTRIEQTKLNHQFQELTEEVETNTHLIREQASKLEFISQAMEEIAEETHERINKLHTEIFDLEEKTEEALFAAKGAVRKVDHLTNELAKEKQRIKDLEAQIERNQQDTANAKLEAELANLRLDSLLKSQELSDFTEQELIFNKLQKTLQLKADEAKLLAQLNLLQYSQAISTPEEPAEREWRVGIQAGTERQLLRPEGMPLDPNSSWAKKFTAEELKEWGWDLRLKAEHESAPLTTPDRRKPETAQTGGEPGEPQLTELNEELWEEIEAAKSKLLEQLQEIQEQIGKNIEQVENQPKIPNEEEKQQLKANLAQLQNEEKQLRQQRATTKAQLTKQTKAQAKTQKEITQLKVSIANESKQLERIEQNLNSASSQPQHQELQTQQQETQQNLAELQEQLQEKQEQLTQQSRQIEKAQETLQEQSKQIETLQTQSQALQQTQAEQLLTQASQQAQVQVAQAQQQLLQSEWQEIQTIQQEVLEEAPAPTPAPVAKLLEEESAQAAAASSAASASSSAQEKQMTYFMLFLIIFLLEYIVYKRNGLPGLVILNICLAIAYYHQDTLREYIDLWDKYVLIIGYVMGNVLAYSAPEPEKYKWPSVIGFNAIIALLYAYTWYQKRQITQQTEKKLEKIHEDTKQEIKKQTEAYEQKVEKLEKGYIKHQASVFNQLEQRPQPQPKQLVLEVQLEQAQEQINQTLNDQEKEELKKEIAQIQQTLQEIKKTSLTSTVNIDLLEEQEPGIKSEWTRVKNWLKGINQPEQDKRDNFSTLTSAIESLPLTEEEMQVLNALNLTQPQMLAISSQSPRLRNHLTELKENYSKLTNLQKLKLLNSGLESLGLKSLQSKQSLANIRHQLRQETQSFDLTLKEKENILRLLITNLNLSPEQRTSLENMGVEFFNASNWQVSEEQKNQLLNFGLNKIELTEEQKQTLGRLHPDAFKTFTLTEPQKTILQSLAPLTKEFKYSKQTLEAIKSLRLKSSSLSFLTQEEILPDTNTAFGETKSPYLPLKLKYLAGEKKVLEAQTKEVQKQTNQEQLTQDKLSIVHSLINFANHTEESLNLNLTLDNWVKTGALANWQKDILLTLGFKTVPKYNFFELLRFALEKFTQQNWTDFLNENLELTGDYQAYLQSQKDQAITINQTILDKFVASRSSKERELLKELNLQELINEQIRQEIANYQFTPAETYPPIPNWEKWKNISLDFTENLVRQWINRSFSYETTKEWIEVGLSIYDFEFTQWIRDEAKLVPEEVLNFKNLEELKAQFTEYQKTGFTPPKSSRYDDLLTTLNQEEQARQQKKQAREDFQQKLNEQQLSRRQANLSAKDQRLAQEAERQQRERELAAQEAEKKRQAFEQRQQELKAQETTRLKAKQEALERAQKLAQEALLIKQQEISLEEQRKQEQIKKLEEANQLEQTRLQTQAQLLAEETKKRLEAVALEDEEQRQKILKDQETKKAELEAEKLEAERNYEREKNAKELAAQRREQEQKEELKRLELRLADAERKKQEEAYQGEREIMENKAKAQEVGVHSYCEEFVDNVLSWIWLYSWNKDERFIQGVPDHAYQKKANSTSMKSLLTSYPHLRFNIFQWVSVHKEKFGHAQSAGSEFMAYTVGDGFFDKEEIKEILKRKCPSKNYIQEQVNKFRS
jgi:chromosome segregation ATPase